MNDKAWNATEGARPKPIEFAPEELGPNHDPSLPHTQLTDFRVDDVDMEWIRRAVETRSEYDCEELVKAGEFSEEFLLPEGGGNLNGRLLAEVCRGYLDFVEAARKQPIN